MADEHLGFPDLHRAHRCGACLPGGRTPRPPGPIWHLGCGLAPWLDCVPGASAFPAIPSELRQRLFRNRALDWFNNAVVGVRRDPRILPVRARFVLAARTAAWSWSQRPSTFGKAEYA